MSSSEIVDAVATDGKTRLLQAASQLFGKQSYAQVSVAEILGIAGLKPPSLYYHFKDKEDLYIAWAEIAFTELGQDLQDSLHAQSDPYLMLRSMARTLSQTHRIDILTTLRDQQLMESAQGREKIVQLYLENVFEPVCQGLLKASQNGVIHPEPIGRNATLFIVGALSLNPQLGLPGTPTTEDSTWWVQKFIRANA
ncbi:MAG: TetR/AcrR family transcriptional regulator [Fimbriimonadaceae bacterium]|nr:TetR/AcrR family transcriptional regulator [Fimbriimonadaceae bacterium]